MKIHSIIFSIFCVVCLFSQVKGQQYLKMINDQKSSIFEIQKAANEYFSKVGTGKGTGYKQYKRWEHENWSKAYPLGNINFQGVDMSKKEFDQFKNRTYTKSADINVWKSLGPDNINTNNGHYSPGLGRIDRIAVDPEHENILYIGGPTNGVWKSVDGGLNWVSKTDTIGSRGVCGIVIDPVNTDKIYWATGDGDNNSTNCTGIYISNDGGESWNMSGLRFAYTEGVKGRKLIMHPTDNNTLLFSCSRGIYKSIDGGANWILNQAGDFDDIFYKADESQIVYASQVGGFFRSTNGGDSFVKVNVDLGGRVFIGLTAAAPNVVYLMTGRKGIYKSTNKGQSFTYIGDHKYTKGEMWHHGTFIISPVDEKLIHTGEFETHKSLDGGYSWVKTSDWTYPNNHYIHCDIHDFVYAGNKLYVCTDGGVSYSTDEGNSWINLYNTMVALEPYRLTVSKTNSNLHMNGSQDNGIYLWDGQLWDGIYGADGMECLIDCDNPNNKYFAIQNGELHSTGHSVTQPGEGDWVSPLVMHPTNPSVMYFGNNKVHKTTDGMQSWTAIGAFGIGNVTNLALGESDPNYIYASKGARLWRTSDDGANWTEITTGLPNQWITRIAVHPSDPLKVAVSLGAFNNGEKVYLSKNGGVTWENYSKQLPNIEARCLVFDDSETDALYLGMDIGIYYIDNTMDNWELYSEGFPMVGVNDLEIHYPSDQIFAASLGRGIWKNSTKNAPTYCTAAGSNQTPGNWIKNVKLETIDQNSDKESYSDFTNVYAKLRIGEDYTMQITLNQHNSNDKCFAWIDSNNNKEFESSELLTFGSFNEEHRTSASFLIPEDVTPGFYTMRLRLQNENEEPTPCGNDIKGEVEDYSVLIEKNILQYCNAVGADGTGADWISNVKLNTIDNTSEQTGYSDFTNHSTDLRVGEEYTIAVTLNYHFDLDKCGAWIDYNQNAVFEANEFIDLPVFSSGEHLYQGNFTVPENSMMGSTRMRVRAVYDNSVVPCNSIFGEVEDYTINIEKVTSSNAKTLAAQKLKVYPNPAKSVLNIELLEIGEKDVILQIFNVEGQLMFSEELGIQRRTKIETSSFKAGLYFIRVNYSDKSVYSKFVVN
ncbi:GEVED domain-containing protein [Maribellus maritimus]|uniref:GEVED domain-containing protein n=1 Tax=Maribellus maritimus TaxID=2870838 RepID=UPI001EEBDAB8|nr:GEVED domain-containing protein [Maribellus maritimus]MCG6189371.1 T9SS type A sorting domain-containing protein [Maribellus maritimus]